MAIQRLIGLIISWHRWPVTDYKLFCWLPVDWIYADNVSDAGQNGWMNCEETSDAFRPHHLVSVGNVVEQYVSLAFSIHYVVPTEPQHSIYFSNSQLVPITSLSSASSVSCQNDTARICCSAGQCISVSLHRPISDIGSPSLADTKVWDSKVLFDARGIH